MIEEINTVEGDTHEPEGFPCEVPFTLPAKAAFSPVSNYIQIEYRKQTTAGGIIIPGQAKPLEFVTSRVVAVGPDCKTVKAGDVIVVATKGIHGGEKGITIDGDQAFFTQESLVVAVVVEPKAQD